MRTYSINIQEYILCIIPILPVEINMCIIFFNNVNVGPIDSFSVPRAYYYYINIILISKKEHSFEKLCSGRRFSSGMRSKMGLGRRLIVLNNFKQFLNHVYCVKLRNEYVKFPSVLCFYYCVITKYCPKCKKVSSAKSTLKSA